jgi:hypothetical protein
MSPSAAVPMESQKVARPPLIALDGILRQVLAFADRCDAFKYPHIYLT